MKKILFLSTSRADYFIIKGLISKCLLSHVLDVSVLPLGFHCVESQGFGVNDVMLDFPGIVPSFDFEKIEDDLLTVASRSTEILISYIKRERIDAAILLGDRYEMLCLAHILTLRHIPIVHLCGGEITLGSVDNKFRNAITQLADYHFVTCEEHYNRVSQLGFPSSRIQIIGSPSIQSLKNAKIFSKDEILNELGIDVSYKFVLMTLHPETGKDVCNQKYIIHEIVQVLEKTNYHYLITASNGDNGGDILNQIWEQLAQRYRRISYVQTLGCFYPSMMHYAHVMLGNTSSGIVEAASFNTYVLNLGSRQSGRPVSKNVQTLEFDSRKIIEKLEQVFIKEKNKTRNVYEKANGQEDFVSFLENEKFEINLSFKDKV